MTQTTSILDPATGRGEKMSDDAKFWDKIAARYAKKPIADEAAYQKKLEVTRRYLRPDSVVFEFGCGTGSTALEHAPHVEHIHATDISPAMVEIAARKAAAAGIENVTFEATTVEATRLPEESVDVVLGLSILHLLKDPEPVIEHVFRALKPGGVFVTNTVCLGENMRWFRFVGPVGRALGLMPYVSVITTQEVEDSMRRAGFAIDYRWQPDSRVLFLVAEKPSAA